MRVGSGAGESSPRVASPMTVVLFLALLAGAAALAFVAARGSPPPETFEDRVRAVASTLRCTVCQGLSVADSPSPVARQMREAIARELRAGKTPDQVRGRMVAAYSEWILLTPPREGFNLLLWIVPVVLLLAGLVVATLAVRRWSAAGKRRAGNAALGEGVGGRALSEDDRRLLDRALARLEERD